MQKNSNATEQHPYKEIFSDTENYTQHAEDLKQYCGIFRFKTQKTKKQRIISSVDNISNTK